MPEPQSFHLLVHLGIAAPDAKTLPVLLRLRDGHEPVASLSVSMYVRYLQREGMRSYETLTKYVACIGKLMDYFILVRNEAAQRPEGLGPLIEDFLYAFDNGSVLGWSPASQNGYVLCRTAVIEYVKFVMDKTESIWPDSEKHFIRACRKSVVSSKHAEQSLLFHTKKRLRKKVGGRKRAVRGLRQFKAFPRKYLDALLEETVNPRDRLLFSVLAFGGRRVSEVLHSFMDDVNTSNETLEISLAHPSLAPMRWKTLSGRLMKGSRREYLRQQFGLMARTEHGALPTFLGWKGIKFDDEASYRSQTYFIRDADHQLVGLHRTYLHELRRRVPRRPHPYYWVGEDGDPLTMKAVEKQFRLACGRVERRHGISLKGYSLHSLRHYFGSYCVDVLKADLLLVQKWMGHMQLSSTAIYAHISPETARDELRAAEVRRSGQGAGQAAISEVVLRHGSTAFGEIDTRNSTRRTR